jgi:hypothetical protein
MRRLLITFRDSGCIDFIAVADFVRRGGGQDRCELTSSVIGIGRCTRRVCGVASIATWSGFRPFLLMGLAISDAGNISKLRACSRPHGSRGALRVFPDILLYCPSPNLGVIR